MATKSKVKNAKQEYISNPFKLIFKGFDSLFKHNQTMSIVILALTLLGSFGQIFNAAGSSTTGGAAASSSANTGAEIALIVALISIASLLFIAAILFFGTIINGAIAYVVYKTSKSETTNFSETMHAVFGKFWTILGVQIVVGLKILGGLLLFIIPGIRAALRYNFVLLPIFDEDATVGKAMQRSKQLTKDHLIEVFGMVTAAAIIPIVGPLMQYGGQSVMYPQLKRLKDSNGAKPPVHWLNYLGFVLIGLFVLFIAMIVGIIVAILHK